MQSPRGKVAHEDLRLLKRLSLSSNSEKAECSDSEADQRRRLGNGRNLQSVQRSKTAVDRHGDAHRAACYYYARVERVRRSLHVRACPSTANGLRISADRNVGEECSAIGRLGIHPNIVNAIHEP